MNTDTNELIKNKDIVPEELRDGFTPVPGHLAEEADKVLDGGDSAIVTEANSAKLAEWAESRRTGDARRLARKKTKQARSKEKKKQRKQNMCNGRH